MADEEKIDHDLTQEQVLEAKSKELVDEYNVLTGHIQTVDQQKNQFVSRQVEITGALKLIDQLKKQINKEDGSKELPTE